METPKMKIRIYGDPCLQKKSDLVVQAGPGERLLIKAMLEAMYANNGIGLAAPQVGINQQIFVADIGDGPIVVINPKVLRSSGSETMEEGCLSLPNVEVEVKRPQRIWVRYLDMDNLSVDKEFSGLMARVFLHESDHLVGKLISDHAGFYQRFHLKKSLKSISRPAQHVL